MTALTGVATEPSTDKLASEEGSVALPLPRKDASLASTAIDSSASSCDEDGAVRADLLMGSDRPFRADALCQALERAMAAVDAPHRDVTTCWRSPLSLFDSRAVEAAVGRGIPVEEVAIVVKVRCLIDHTAHAQDLTDFYKRQVETARVEGRRLNRLALLQQLECCEMLAQHLEAHLPLLQRARASFDKPHPQPLPENAPQGLPPALLAQAASNYEFPPDVILESSDTGSPVMQALAGAAGTAAGAVASAASKLKRAASGESTILPCDFVEGIGEYVIVGQDEVPVNSGISRDSARVSTLKAGTRVEVLAIAESWEDGRVRGRIASPAGWISLRHKRGYCFACALRLGEWVIVYDDIPIRAELSRSSQTLYELAQGTRVEVVEIADGTEDDRVRARITYGSREGWISLLDVATGQEFAHRWREEAIRRGRKAVVTSDAARYERECLASKLTWPLLQDESQRRDAKMGKEGCVETVDLRDSTAKISGGTGWVPIRAIVGFEDWREDHQAEVVFLPMELLGKPILVQEAEGRWRVDNSHLGHDSIGPALRVRKEIGAKHPSAVVEWGELLEGVNEGDGWLRCRSKMLDATPSEQGAENTRKSDMRLSVYISVA